MVIGGMAVSHHGYARFTADVDIMVPRDAAAALYRRLKSEPGWRRYAEGFKNTIHDVGLDICVEGERTSPRSEEVFPDPRTLRTLKVRPLPVIALPELIALKVKSGRVRDEADVVELLKLHFRRAASLERSAARLLGTAEAKERLEALVIRATEEKATRRR